VIGTDDAWKWLKTAPLPVVLVFVLALATWVWSVSKDQAVEHGDLRVVTQRVDNFTAKVDKMDAKLDDLLGLVIELRVRAEDAKNTAASNRAADQKPKK
jgi:hypothetical protein